MPGFAEMFLDWPVGTLMMSLATLFVVAVVGYLIYGVGDTLLSTKKTLRLRVTDRRYTPARTDMIMTYNAATKTSMPQPVYRSESFELLLNDPATGDSHWVPTSSALYEQFKNGGEADFVITIGGWSRAYLYAAM